MRFIRFLMVATMFAGMASGRELLLNGDFERDALGYGWRWDTFGLFNDTGNCHLWQSYSWSPDRDREVCVHKVLHQWASLTQTVGIPHLNLNFSASAKLFCKTERSDTGYYASANLFLDYIGFQDSVLGTTFIHSHTGGCTWQNSPTVHIIPAPDTNRWHNYSFNVASELNNLPGVNPAEVRKIRVGILSYCRNNC